LITSFDKGCNLVYIMTGRTILEVEDGTKTCPNAGNGDLKRFRAIWRDFASWECVPVAQLWLKMSKKASLAGDPRNARKRTRNGALWRDFERKT